MLSDNEITSRLLATAQASERLHRLRSGRFVLPRFTFDAPPDPIYGFPCAFLPVLSVSGWPGYIGIVHHWFGTTATTFAKYYVETSELVQISPSEDGFFDWLMDELRCLGVDKEELERLTGSLGIDSMKVQMVIASGNQSLPELSTASDGQKSEFRELADHCVPANNRSIGDALASCDWESLWYDLSRPGWQDLDERSILEFLSTRCSDANFGEFCFLRLALREIWGY